MEKLWLSEAMKEYKKTLNYGVLNLINAPAGSGKTNFIFEELIKNYKMYGIKNLRLNKVIYVCDTSSLKKKVLKEDMAKEYEYGDLDNISDNEFENGKIIVMTYAKLGTLLNNYEHKDKVLNSDVIIFDEVHQIPIYSYKFDDKVDGSKNRKGVYSNVLKHMPEIIEKCNCIGLSATIFENEINKFEENGCICRKIFKKQSEINSLRSYNYKPKYINYTFNILKEYVIYNEMFKNTEYDLGKMLIYTHTIEQAEKYKQYLMNNGINAEWLCSENRKDYDKNGKKLLNMNDYQVKLKENLIETGEVYDNIQVLIINAAYETGIDIFDEDRKFKYIIIGSTKDVTRIQARNRIRHDIEELYVLSKFDYDWMHNIWCVPICDNFGVFVDYGDEKIYTPNLTAFMDDKYINIKLTQELKDEMIEKYSIKQCGKENNEFTFKSIIEDIKKLCTFKVFVDSNENTWIFREHDLKEYLKSNGLKYNKEIAKRYIKFLNKENKNIDNNKGLCAYLDRIVGKKLYVKDLEKKELIEKINVRKNGKILKKMEELNDKLKKENIPYEIIDDTDWNRKLDDGYQNKNYGKKYWIVEERHL